MKRSHAYLTFIVATSLAGCTTTPTPTGEPSDLTAFMGVTLVSLEQDSADREGVTLLVRDDTILSVIDEDAIPAGAARIDVQGLFALPGIIDTHIHVATPPDRADAEEQLRAMFRSGVTTARSMADDLRAAADLSRSAYQHDIQSPDIIYSAVFAGPTFMADPRVEAVTAGLTPGDIPWMRTIDADTDIRAAVTLARESGASGIKIYADLNADLVQSIAAEAKLQNIPTWAHSAVYPASPAEVAAAGVTTMSHACSFAHLLQPTMPDTYKSRTPMPDRDPAQPVDAVLTTFQMMEANNIILDATSAIYDHLETERPDRQLCSGALSADMTRLAIENGVRLSTGTDFVTDDGPAAIHVEMRYLHDVVGLSIDEVWTAATATGADIVGQSDQLGRIAPGYLANILFYSADPTQDLGALDSLQTVVKRGQITPIR